MTREHEEGEVNLVRTTRSKLGTAVRDPATRIDLLQVVKATLATVLAWLVASAVFDLSQGFLASWAALSTVHASVYRSVWRGGQAVVATFLGVFVAYGAVQVLGSGALGLGVAVLFGLLVGRLPLLRQEGVVAATTALFVVTSSVGVEAPHLMDRLLDTLVGVVVGVLVNLLVVPPVDGRQHESSLRRAGRDLGTLLALMADSLEETDHDPPTHDWIEETRAIDSRLDAAQELLTFSQETQWGNPRRRRSPHVGDVEQGTDTLTRLEDGVTQARAIARIVAESSTPPGQWDAEFRARWTELLREVGRRVAEPEPDVRSVRGDLRQLASDLSIDDLPNREWPMYGALITALLGIVVIVDDVASVQRSSSSH